MVVRPGTGAHHRRAAPNRMQRPRTGASGSCSMTLDVAGTALGPFSDSVSISTTPSGGLQPVDVTGDLIPALSGA